MTRNLNRRVEVVFPIFNEAIQTEIRAIVDLQMQDNVDARVLDLELTNRHRPLQGRAICSQMETYRLLRDRTARSALNPR
jgi:polyphosphate kinase